MKRQKFCTVGRSRYMVIFLHYMDRQVSSPSVVRSLLRRLEVSDFLEEYFPAERFQRSLVSRALSEEKDALNSREGNGTGRDANP